jgi:bile acid-coenzyme A ligase
LPDVTPPHERALASGGSTGQPKLILPRNPGAYDPEAPSPIFKPRAAVLVPGPLYHAVPFSAAWQGLFAGAKVVLMRRFDASECLALIEKHRIDRVHFVPTMMQRIWKLPVEERTRHDLSSLNVVFHLAAPCPDWLKREWITWLGPERIWELYAGTEAQSVTVIKGNEWLEHPGSVGRPVVGEMRILDEHGEECPPGVQGEVFMRPPEGVTTYRYIGAEAKARDGWESLGDMGWMDADGYLYLGDRAADMTLAGGANIYPAEIEAALDAHPAVGSSCVIGLPDEDLGNRIHAIVQVTSPVTDDELRVHLADRLVRYKIPRSFEYVGEPLRDDAGKVRRSALRAARL